jgi:hypothetical protein
VSCSETNCFIDESADLEAEDPLALFEQVRDHIERCLEHRRCFFVLEFEPAHRYVQGLVGDGLVLESVSNPSLGPACGAEHGLSADDQRALVKMGWTPPDEDSPNWYRVLDCDWHAPAALASEVLVRTLTEVHRARPSDVRLWFGHAVDPLERTGVEPGG